MTSKSQISSKLATSVVLDLKPPPRNVTFHDESDGVVGELDFSDGTLKFSGNAEESAKLFFDCLIKHNNDQLKQATDLIEKIRALQIVEVLELIENDEEIKT